ncbi:adhesion G protein-coupled receptor E1-like [Osmerus mordax]|uniref:adhesion G protein-coupled receptor E1-like n=1 Tax=Osmerus mordax TaxID=8014 RepID=UPI00350EA3CA
MTYCVLSLFLGFLFIPAPGYLSALDVFPSGSCDGYLNISEPHRNLAYTEIPVNTEDDAVLQNKWWRFVGIGGDQIIRKCVANNLGGTNYPLYLNFVPPTSQSESSTVGSACSSRYPNSGYCCYVANQIEMVLCPGGFYVFKPTQHSHRSMAFVIFHSNCTEDSCGPLAQCTAEGGCVCVSGYKIPPTYKPTNESYGCQDIDECVDTTSACGSYSNCTNTPGKYSCVCLQGYTPSNPLLEPSNSNACQDLDECSTGICSTNGMCTNNIGSYICSCNDGYSINENITECLDVDECFNSTICGPDSICTNTPGAYSCACLQGYIPTNLEAEPSQTNICQDLDECVTNTTICGPDANCTNSIGAYTCTCNFGFRETNPDFISSILNPCLDIDECGETPGLCGQASVCDNVPGTFYCSCQDGYFPSTGLMWEMHISVCQSVQEILDRLNPPEGQTKETYFLNNMDQELQNNSDTILQAGTVTNGFSATLEVSGVKDDSKKSRTASASVKANTGSLILGISARLVSALVDPTQNQTNITLTTNEIDISLQAVGPETEGGDNTTLSAKGNTMMINLQAVAQNNNGSAAAVFMTINRMESLLSHSFFETENQTEMYSDVITATLPKTNKTQLSQPVNFTIQHKRRLSESDLVTCVYWEKKSVEKEGIAGGEEVKMFWSVEGCWVAFSDENYTVCSCSHLSTFALILQTGKVAVEDPFIEWVNKVCVCIGLVFLALAILTFLLCSWNPKINNTARLHLCICLFLTHLLLLLDKAYVDSKLICKAMAGLLHFLVVASFVWMLLEALQLYLLVRMLSRVQVIQRDGLPRPYLYLIGYGVPTVIVGVSAWVNSGGYGTPTKCWLSNQKYFSWALTGPVIAVLAMNWILFCVTLWSLRPTLVSMRSDVSQSKDTRLIVFKILAQFIILGCTWILGFYQTSTFSQYLFILLNSQQGTFLYIVHCLFNKEVREQYYRFITCSSGSASIRGSVKETPSTSEDLDKTGEKKDTAKD